MRCVRALVVAALLLIIFSGTVLAQWPDTSPAVSGQLTAAPIFVRVEGDLKDPSGNPRAGMVLVRLSLYADKQDSAPLWVEEQPVTLRADGHYTVFAGATQADGLPRTFFADGARHWLGVSVPGDTAENRFMIASVPYAERAREAEMLAGKSISDFVLSKQLAGAVKSALTNTGSEVTSTPNTLPKYVDANGTLGSSDITSVGGNLGIGTAAPSSGLEIYHASPVIDYNNTYFHASHPLSETDMRQAGVVIDGAANIRMNTSLTVSGNPFQTMPDFVLGKNYMMGISSDVGPTDPSLLILTTNANGGPHIEAYTGTPSAGVPVFRIANNGSAQFGVNPATSGVVNIPNSVALKARNRDNNGDYQIAQLTTNNVLMLSGDGNSTSFGGNVGIGTTTPTAKLQVAGNVSVDGNIGIKTVNPQRSLEVSSTGSPVIRLSGGAGSNQFMEFSKAGVIKGTWGYSAASDTMQITYGGNFGANSLAISSNGNVGIGTVSPTAKLDVAGNVNVSGHISATYQDVAEWVETSATLEPGTVVIVDPVSPNRVMPSGRAYDTRVAGAVSSRPGLVLGERSDTKAMVAQSGRVRVKVDARYGPVKIGDLLVTSPREGYAMRSKPLRIRGQEIHRPGTLLGKALEALPTGTGEILVLLTLQ